MPLCYPTFRLTRWGTLYSAMLNEIIIICRAMALEIGKCPHFIFTLLIPYLIKPCDVSCSQLAVVYTKIIKGANPVLGTASPSTNGKFVWRIYLQCSGSAFFQSSVHIDLEAVIVRIENGGNVIPLTSGAEG